MFLSRRRNRINGGGKLKDQAAERKQIQKCIDGNNSVRCILNLLKLKCKAEKALADATIPHATSMDFDVENVVEEHEAINMDDYDIPRYVEVDTINTVNEPTSRDDLVYVKKDLNHRDSDDSDANELSNWVNMVKEERGTKGGARQRAYRCASTTCLLKLLNLNAKISKALNNKNKRK